MDGGLWAFWCWTVGGIAAEGFSFLSNDMRFRDILPTISGMLSVDSCRFQRVCVVDMGVGRACSWYRLSLKVHACSFSFSGNYPLS